VTPAATPAPRRPAVAETPAEPKAEKPAPARRAAAPAPAAAPQPEPEAAEPVEQVRNPFAGLFGRKEQPQAAPATTASTSAAAPAGDDEDAAPAKPAARANVGSGSFAVQLSSSPTEGDARAAATRLGGRFASQLGGRSARVVKGEAAGKTVYRVRAGGMSREGAVSACESIKSSGGSCFVAQD
jgi:septal ring-binding cell division protein DamX